MVFSDVETAGEQSPPPLVISSDDEDGHAESTVSEDSTDSAREMQMRLDIHELKERVAELESILRTVLENQTSIYQALNYQYQPHNAYGMPPVSDNAFSYVSKPHTPSALPHTLQPPNNTPQTLTSQSPTSKTSGRPKQYLPLALKAKKAANNALSSGVIDKTVLATEDQVILKYIQVLED